MSDLSRIIARIFEIETAQATLAAELDELMVAKRVLLRFSAKEDVKRAALAPQLARLPRTGTTRDTFLQVLRITADPWMTANDIRERASALRGVDVPMGTVSPTLTDLKNAHLIIREGMKVALASRINQNNEAPPEADGASNGSDSGSEALFRETAVHDR
jgi:hypothetical protein